MTDPGDSVGSDELSDTSCHCIKRPIYNAKLTKYSFPVFKSMWL